MGNNWNRSKPAWVRYQENQEARRDAAQYERTHNIGAVMARQTTDARKSEQYLSAKADVVKAVAQFMSGQPTIEELKALGGYTVIIGRYIDSITAGKTCTVTGQQVALGNLLRDEISDIRNAAIKAA